MNTVYLGSTAINRIYRGSELVYEWSPTSLFANSEQGALYTPGPTTCFQDAAGTTPAGNGDPVGYLADLSGNGNHATQATSAARPTLTQDAGGNWYLAFDGIDDLMLSPTITGIGAGFFFAAAISAQSFDGDTRGVVAFGVYPDSSNRAAFTLRLSGGGISIPSVEFRALGGDLFSIAGELGKYSDSAPHISSGGVSDATVFLNIDGASKGVSPVSEINTFDGPIKIGQGANASIDFYGGVFVLRNTTSAGDIAATENHLANLSGVTL